MPPIGKHAGCAAPNTAPPWNIPLRQRPPTVSAMPRAFVTMLVLSTASWAQAPVVIAEELYNQLDPSFVNHNQDQTLGIHDPASSPSMCTTAPVI
jgi:hypothetical protein